MDAAGRAAAIGDRLAAVSGPPTSTWATPSATTCATTRRSGSAPVRPTAVVRPGVHRRGGRHRPGRRRTRGAGHGAGLGHRTLGRAVPVPGRHRRLVRAHGRPILEIDVANQVAVVEPGVTLAELDAALAPLGLVYPVFPGEQSASLGGNVSTNAGGMRAVKYGVTRHHVLGLEAVLGTGEVISTGGRFVKSTSGYDLTQLIIGSEGTLALVTRAILRLHPRPEHQATLLAPFATVDQVAGAVPPVVASGVGPLLVEYIDMMSMAGITANAGIDLGIPDDVRAAALAYLVIVLEDHHAERRRGGHRGAGHPARRARRARRLRAARPCRPRSSSPPASTRSGRRRRPAPTTSSTSSCPGPRSPPTWPTSATWPQPPGRWWSAAGTPATATSTCRCSSPTRRSATGSSTTSWPPAWPSAAPCRASTGSARPSWRPSPTWRTR